jgi:hypothetical protein
VDDAEIQRGAGQVFGHGVAEAVNGFHAGKGVRA